MDILCLRHFISHDVRYSCPECVIADAQEARENLVKAQRSANEDFERRSREDREEREEERRRREREADPDYWADRELRSRIREREKQELIEAGRFVALAVVERIKLDLMDLERERASRIQKGDTGRGISRLFGSPLPDKDYLAVSHDDLVVDLGHLYQYRFDTPFESFLALTFITTKNEKTRSPNVERAIADCRARNRSDARSDLILRKGHEIQERVRALEKPLEAKAREAVAAAELSRNTCTNRNSTCPGWHFSGFTWTVTPELGWHWTGGHVLTICGDRHVFETPYEYMAVFKARTERYSAKGEKDEWGEKQLKAFANDHDGWCVSHFPR